MHFLISQSGGYCGHSLGTGVGQSKKHDLSGDKVLTFTTPTVDA